MNESAPITGTRSSPVWPNGYAWRYEIRLPARPGGGTVDNLLLPFAARSDEFKSVAHGGRVESASGHDIRFEGGDGAKLGHVLVSTGTDDGAIAGFVNIASRTYEAEQSIFLCIGKSSLRGTEENAADARAGGWLFVHTGAVATDYSGNGRPFTDGAGVSTDTIGPWPAGRFDGSTDYRARRSTELHALSALSYFVLLRSDMPDTAREALHIATGSVADLSLRKPSGNGFRQTMNVGGVSTELATGDGLCRHGVGHAVAGAWRSGEAPTFVLDGATPDLPAAPGVATGTSSLAGTLEIGRGGLATPNYGYWAGAIGPFFACNRRLPRQALEEITAALAEPRLAYNLGAADAPPVTDRPPVEQPATAPPLAPYMGRGFGVSIACVNAGNTLITKPVTYSMKAPRTGTLRRVVIELASNNAKDYRQEVTIGGVRVPKGTKSYGAGPIDVPVQFVEGKAPRPQDRGDDTRQRARPPSVPDFTKVLATATIVHDRGDGRGGGGAYRRAFQAFDFASPVPVVAGRHYHVVVRVDPNRPTNANAISINAPTYRQGDNYSRIPYSCSPPRRFGPYWGDDDVYTMFSQTSGDPADPFWTRRDTYYGIFDWHYTDGFTFGPGYRQSGHDLWAQCPIEGANRVRQRWRCVLPSPLSFRYAMFWAFYLANGGDIPAGGLTLTLYNETDGGSVSASLRPSPAARNTPDNVPRWTYPGDVDYADWCRFDFGGARTLAPGKTYRIEATAPAGHPYRTGPIQSIYTNPLDTRDCDGSPTNVWRALPGQPDANVQAYAQRSSDGGSSWVGMTLWGTSHDRRDTHLPIYFEAL